jgi:oxygen-independent coproporphyrinogen-3 oxidase
MEGLYLEWQHYLPLIRGKNIVSIYFGGGTPSLLGPQRLATILDWIAATGNPEITMEANPELLTLELMKAYTQAGVNRVSIGVQSFDNALLHRLSRQHDADEASQAVLLTAEAGINNISIDLMYDLPTQTLEQWETSLQQACKLPITHLSLYNLTIEPHTVFFKYASSLTPLLPDPEASLKMYQMALDILPRHHLEPYEISAFAKNDLYSRHNIGYWTGRPFLGLGPSAFSYWEGKRFRNIANLNRYTQALKEGKSPIDFSEELSPDAQQRELLAIRLRLREGALLDNFHVDAETEAALQRLVEQGFLHQDTHQNHFRLTEKGILFYDTVATELI